FNNTGSKTVTAIDQAGVNPLTAGTNASVTVSSATASFSNLSASQTITYGTASITVSGTVSGPGPVYPGNGELVAVAINGDSHNATISGGAGGFSLSFPTGIIPASGTAYTISYSYAGDSNLGSASNSSTTLTVNKASPAFSGLSSSQTIPYGTASINLS